MIKIKNKVVSMTHDYSNSFITNIIESDLSSNKHSSIKTRFPPEPNGYLHIGHAKSICANFGLAAKYQGTCNLRFDDTNPEKEKVDYVDSIKQDISWLGFSWNELRNSSDYFDDFYNYALELIDKNLAYVCFLTNEEMREYRGTLTEAGKDSPYRNTDPQENRKLFIDMKNGVFPENKCVLRAKIDMTSSFMCMRDPVIYRIKFAAHHQTQDKWCIYPMYDFAHCISDAIENITHSICTLEFQDNRRLYNWVIDNISIPAKPEQYEFSRLNLEYTVMSKRKLAELVEQKIVSGWDDPRMPTIAGMRRRGYTPQAIRDFCYRIGLTKQDNVIELSMLEFCVREDLNAIAPRSMAVLDPVKLVITNLEADEVLSLSQHPELDLPARKVHFTKEIWIDRADFKTEANKKYKRLVLGKEVRLRGAYVVKADSVDTDAEGNITTIHCTYDADTLGKNPEDRKVKGVIHWVSAKYNKPSEFRLYGNLFNNKLVDDLSDYNPSSLVIKNGYVEQNIDYSALKNYQFEREGYFCIDPDSTEDNIICNLTVTLRSSFA